MNIRANVSLASDLDSNNTSHRLQSLYSYWSFMESGDDWLAADKLYHIVFCFFVSIIASLLASQTRYAFVRRYSIWVGSVVSSLAGAAKEFADELGFFQSSGASAKDAVADFLGILLAALVLYVSKYKPSSPGMRPDSLAQSQVLEMV